jgi:hypothetical protein
MPSAAARCFAAWLLASNGGSIMGPDWCYAFISALSLMAVLVAHETRNKGRFAAWAFNCIKSTRLSRLGLGPVSSGALPLLLPMRRAGTPPK